MCVLPSLDSYNTVLRSLLVLRSPSSSNTFPHELRYLRTSGVVGSIVSPERYIEVLSPDTCECDLIWK